MEFTESELADLRAAQEICKRPLRCQGRPLGHEDVPRTPDGLIIVSLDNENVYIPECSDSKQHLACPHLLDREVYDENGTLSRVIALLEKLDPNLERENLRAQMTSAGSHSTDLDNQMRVARTNTETDDEFDILTVPDMREARLNALPIEANFIQFSDVTIAPIQRRMLELVDRALGSAM